MVATEELHPPEVIAELKKNQEAYNNAKEQMEAEHWGRTVLLHDGTVVAIYNDEGDATTLAFPSPPSGIAGRGRPHMYYDIGCEKFGLGHFSLHRVGERPVDLGFHAMSLRPRD